MDKQLVALPQKRFPNLSDKTKLPNCLSSMSGSDDGSSVSSEDSNTDGEC